MLKLENTEVMGWDAAIRGMRNPKNSWTKSDSGPGCRSEQGVETFCHECTEGCPKPGYVLGKNDLHLAETLAGTGTDHRKFLRMIVVYTDIIAPLYWWKEYDTYKVGTVANSCSTMHRIAAKQFTLSDFSYGQLGGLYLENLQRTIDLLNDARDKYLWYLQQDKPLEEPKNYWWQMIQLLPSSYNQRRTLMLNYEVLANIYPARRHHKLDEWHVFCDWIETLPYAQLITGKSKEE